MMIVLNIIDEDDDDESDGGQDDERDLANVEDERRHLVTDERRWKGRG